MMERVTQKDILPLPAYEQVRDDFRREMIAYKKNRRLFVGDAVTLVFEDKKTMIFQVQEMLRAEKITDPEAVQYELDVYNKILPDENELSATLFIQFSDTSKVREEAKRYKGISRNTYLVVGEHEIRGELDEMSASEDRAWAVQYLRFRFSPEAKEAFLHGEAPVRVEIRDTVYQEQAELPAAMREALKADFR